MSKDHQNFLKLSSELTGYSTVDLEGTGLVKLFDDLVAHEIGDKVTEFLYDTARFVFNHKTEEERELAMRIYIIASPTLWPACKAIITLWYRGQWTSMSPVWFKYYAGVEPGAKVVPGKTKVPFFAAAYTQQLSYRAAGAHPPGAHPTGFGSWGIDPVFGDFINNK